MRQPRSRSCRPLQPTFFVTTRKCRAINRAMPKLNPEQIKTAMASVPAWRRKGSVISRTYEAKDFLASIAFVNQVAKLAEKACHHPDIAIAWNKVTLSLTTHDSGGLTEKDFALAAACDKKLKP